MANFCVRTFFHFCPLKNLLVPHPNFDADAATNQPYLSVGARWQNFSDISIPFPIVPKFSMILPTFPPFFRSIFSTFSIFSPHYLSKRGHSTPLILLVLASIVLLKHMLSTDGGQNFATFQMIVKIQIICTQRENAFKWIQTSLLVWWFSSKPL